MSNTNEIQENTNSREQLELDYPNILKKITYKTVDFESLKKKYLENEASL